MKQALLIIAFILIGILPAAAEDLSAMVARELSDGTYEGISSARMQRPSTKGEHDPSIRFMESSLQRQPSAPIASITLATHDSLPLTLNDDVAYFIHFFQTRGKETYSRWLASSTRYLPVMKDILRREGLPETLVYVAMIESGFKLHARSVANAVGPWQFMAGTGQRYALRIDQWVDERRDPVKATMAAAMYFKDLYALFNQDWYLAAAGYNAGENKILRAIDRYDSMDFWELCKGDYLKQETKQYVPKLLAAAIIAQNPEKYGFTKTIILPVTEYDTALLTSQTDLGLVARLTGTSLQTIRELNPSLLQNSTPPDYRDFMLKIPKGTKEDFERGIAGVPPEERYKITARAERPVARSKKVASPQAGHPAETVEHPKGVPAAAEVLVPEEKQVLTKLPDTMVSKLYYTVRRGDTVTAIARRFKVPAAMIEAWNNIKSTVLVPGHQLVVARYETKESIH